MHRMITEHGQRMFSLRSHAELQDQPRWLILKDTAAETTEEKSVHPDPQVSSPIIWQVFGSIWRSILQFLPD